MKHLITCTYFYTSFSYHMRLPEVVYVYLLSEFYMRISYS